MAEVSTTETTKASKAEVTPPSEKTPVYPDLKQRIDDPSFRLKVNVATFFGMRVARTIMTGLRQTVMEGKVDIPLYLDEEKGGPGLYEIRMGEKEATQFFEAADEFLTNPLKYENLAGSMGPDLEQLLKGKAPAESYKKIGELPE